MILLLLDYRPSDNIIRVVVSPSRTELVRQRQAVGILGMFFAIIGGVAWFLRQNIIAIILWGVAGLILLKLNKRSRSKRRQKYNDNYQ